MDPEALHARLEKEQSMRVELEKERKAWQLERKKLSTENADLLQQVRVLLGGGNATAPPLSGAAAPSSPTHELQRKCEMLGAELAALRQTLERERAKNKKNILAAVNISTGAAERRRDERFDGR